MGVEPQFSGWEIGSPPPSCKLSYSPPGAWVRVRQQEEEAVAAAAFPWWVRCLLAPVPAATGAAL
jgi:hypothetical protein